MHVNTLWLFLLIQGGASSHPAVCVEEGGGQRGCVKEKEGGRGKGVELGGVVCFGRASLFPWFPQVTSPTTQTYETNRYREYLSSVISVVRKLMMETDTLLFCRHLPSLTASLAGILLENCWKNLFIWSPVGIFKSMIGSLLDLNDLFWNFNSKIYF